MSDPGTPPFDAEKASGIVGSYVLIGITHLDDNEQLLSQEQVHGVVLSADAEFGVCIVLRGSRADELFYLPPDFHGWEAAQPGTYTLRSTGERVHDPDWLCQWVHTSDPPEPRIPEPEGEPS